MPGWTRFEGAEEWLKKQAAQPPAVAEREQFDRFLQARSQAAPGAISIQQREELFKEFMQWSKTRR